MKLIFTSLLLLLCFHNFAQDTRNHDYFWTREDSYKAIIGANNCYVRLEPSVSTAILDSLQLGNEILVLKSTDKTLKIKGINVSWVQIQYTKKSGESKNGFLWKGFLALNYTKKAGNTYLTTIDKIAKKLASENYEVEDFYIIAKILDDNNNLLDQKTIQKSISDSDYFENKTIGALGLKNLQDIYRISFSGEACGIPTFYYYFGWTGEKLLLLPEKYAVGDAGTYYYSEEFIFPKELGGKPDLIIKKVEEAENADETGESDDYVFNVSEWREIYKWDGAKATLIKKEKPKKYKKKM